jgi:ClpP class serine protease
MSGPGAQKLAGTYRSYVVNGIGILPVTGPIFPRANLLTEMSGATSLTMLQNDHRVLLDNKDVKSIMMLMDTPGGAVSGIASFALQVGAGARRKETTAYVTGVMASAGYWIGSAATRVSIDRTAILGSIGVLAAVPKQVQPDADGMIEVEIVSTNAPNKRPDPQSEDGVSNIRATLDAIEKVFINDIARSRGVPVSKVISDFGRGGVMIGQAAVNAGMADVVESQASAMNTLRLAGMRSPTQRSASASQYSGGDQTAANLRRLEQLRRARGGQAATNLQRLQQLRRAR